MYTLEIRCNLFLKGNCYGCRRDVDVDTAPELYARSHYPASRRCRKDPLAPGRAQPDSITGCACLWLAGAARACSTAWPLRRSRASLTPPSNQNGVRVFVDPTSMMYLGGATIDYVDSLMGGGFRIDNPNAVSTCGCGHSFRTAGSGRRPARAIAAATTKPALSPGLRSCGPYASPARRRTARLSCH